MKFEIFRQSIAESKIPDGLSPYLQALWHDGKGDWEASHNIIQNLPGDTASWIHAYLHRKEGDIGNADYWYSKAGKKRPETDLPAEWEVIVKALL